MIQETVATTSATFSPAAVVARRPGLLWTIGLVFVLSGAAGLIYQVLWVRLLTLAFGVTAYAVSTVLASFMGGLALGSLIGGRLADRSSNPLRLYGLVEVLLGGVGLLTPSAYVALQTVYRDASLALPEGDPLVPLLRFVLAVALLLVPTTLMGATLPLLVRAVSTEGEVGARVSLLYFLNTLGAAVGSFTAGFFLVEGVGIASSVRVAAGLNLSVGTIALLLSLWVKTPSGSVSFGDGLAGGPAQGQPAPQGRLGQGPVGLVLAVIGLSGFCSFAYEVVWFRVLEQLFDAIVYAFAIMLTAVLLGIAFGGIAAAPFTRTPRRALTTFGIVELAVGLSAAALLSLFPKGPELAREAQELPFLGHLIQSDLRSMTFIALLTLFVPSFLLGLTYPLAVASVRVVPGYLGRWVGTTYASNVLGAILGSLAGGFALLPLLGAESSLLWLGAVNFVLGLGLLLAVGGQPLARLGVVSLVGATGLLFLAVAEMRPDFHPALFTARHPASGLVWHQEGPEATISVGRHHDEGFHTLYINGRPQADETGGVSGFHRVIGHTGMLLHPNPRQALVVGLGGGSTAGAVALHTGVQVTIVELSPGVVAAHDFFTSVNLDVLRRPNVSLRIDDGRNFLLRTRDRYDLITADIVRPEHAGSTNLYSADYFRLVRDALAEDGLAVQWLEGLNEYSYLILLRTFLSVFPDSTLWYGGAIVVGGKRPQSFSEASVAQAFQRPGLLPFLEEMGWGVPEAFLVNYDGRGRELHEMVGQGPIITDDRPLVEYFRSLRPG